MAHYVPITFPQEDKLLHNNTVNCRSVPTASTSMMQAFSVSANHHEETALLAICDTPSSMEMRSFEERLAARVLFQKHFVQNSGEGTFRPVLVIHIPTMRSNNYVELFDSLDSMQDLMKTCDDLDCLEYVFTGSCREKDKYGLYKEFSAVLREWSRRVDIDPMNNDRGCLPFWMIMLQDMIAKTTPVAHVIDLFQPDQAQDMLAQLLRGNRGNHNMVQPEEEKGGENSNNHINTTDDDYDDDDDSFNNNGNCYVSSFRDGFHHSHSSCKTNKHHHHHHRDTGFLINLPTQTVADEQQVKLHVERLVARYNRAHQARLYTLARKTVGELGYLAQKFTVAAHALDRLMVGLCCSNLSSSSSSSDQQQQQQEQEQQQQQQQSEEEDETYCCYPDLEDLAERQALAFLEQAIQMTKEDKQQQQQRQPGPSGGDEDVECIEDRVANLMADSPFQGNVFDFLISKVTQEQLIQNGQKSIDATTTTTIATQQEDRREKLEQVLERHADLVQCTEQHYWYQLQDANHHKMMNMSSAIHRAQEQLIQGAQVIVQDDLTTVEKGLSELKAGTLEATSGCNLWEELKAALIFLFQIHHNVRSKFSIPPDEEVYIDPWAWLDAVPQKVIKLLVELTQAKIINMESTLKGTNNDNGEGDVQNAFVLFCLWGEIQSFHAAYKVQVLVHRFQTAALGLVTQCIEFMDEAVQLIQNPPPDEEITQGQIDEILHGAGLINHLIKTVHTDMNPTIFVDEVSKCESILRVLQEAKQKAVAADPSTFAVNETAPPKDPPRQPQPIRKCTRHLKRTKVVPSVS